MQQSTGTVINNQICRAIEQLRAVELAHVVMDGGSEVIEVHVVATPERKPKQVVRDIETLLMAQFGLDVDYRRISLAQVEGGPFLSGRIPRAQLVAAEYVDQDRHRVQVVLEEGGQRHTGTAEVSAVADNSLALAALATLGALHGLIGRPTVFHLEEIRKTRLGDRDIVLVLTTAVHEGGEERLVGTCFARGDILEACARATLNSINRRLFWYFREM